MSNGSALVNDTYPAGLQTRQVIHRCSPSGFHDLDTALDDRLAIVVVRNWIDGRQERQVHAERTIGQGSRLGDGTQQGIAVWIHMRRDEAQSTGIGDCGH